MRLQWSLCCAAQTLSGPKNEFPHLLRELAPEHSQLTSRNCFTWGHISPRTLMWVHLQGLPRFWAPHGISWNLCCDGSTAQLFVPHHIVYLFLPQLLTLSLLHNNLCSWITMCCVSFRCTAKWLSYKYTYIHFFPILFAFRILQDIEQIVPMLYSKSLLVIYFFQDYVYFY